MMMMQGLVQHKDCLELTWPGLYDVTRLPQYQSCPSHFVPPCRQHSLAKYPDIADAHVPVNNSMEKITSAIFKFAHFPNPHPPYVLPIQHPRHTHTSSNLLSINRQDGEDDGWFGHRAFQFDDSAPRTDCRTPHRHPQIREYYSNKTADTPL